MTTADWLIIIVTFIGPVSAVQVQKWVERAREQRNRRLWIFQTLMATRAVRAGSNDHVQALNLIELFFDGKSAKEKKVRNAWVQYHDFLAQRVPDDMSSIESGVYHERGVDLLVVLLEALGMALGYDFNKVQLKRGGYYPQGQANDDSDRAVIRAGLVRVLTGVQPLQMSIVSFPVSDEALIRQQMVQDALLKTLSGEKPLKVEAAPRN